MRRVAVGLALVAVLAAAGCGGDSSSAAEEWAGGVCTALDTYVTSLKGIGDSVGKAGLSKSSLQDAASQAGAATDTFVSDLDALGAPDTEKGAEAKAAVDGLAASLKKDVETVSSLVDGLSGSDDLLSVITQVGSTLTAAKNEIVATFDELEQIDAHGELQKGFDQADSCDALKESL